MQERWIVGKTVASIDRQCIKTDWGNINVTNRITFTDGSFIYFSGVELTGDYAVETHYRPAKKETNDERYAITADLRQDA